MRATADRRWLFGPVPDLVLGCGAGYAVVFAAMVLFGASFRELLPLGIAFLPINLVSSAHYGATALRAYGTSDDRRTWLLFTLWTTLLLGGCFVWGLASVPAGSWFVTLYLTWSPWHYALQNFGVAMTYLRRRGIAVTPAARRLTYASFVLSFFLAAVALHGVSTGATYAPNQLESGVYAFQPFGRLLGIPKAWTDGLLWALGAVYVGATAAAVVVLRQAATWRDLAPTLVLVGTQALWFSVPVLARHGGALQGVEPFAVEHSLYAFLWIGAGHSVQYLWITAYFAKASGRSGSHTVFVTKSLLAGTALWVVPAFVFAPGLLGRLPYDAGLAAMVAALVNLHHFVLDGVIWKLRESRIARFLVGTGDGGARAVGGEAGAAGGPVSAGRVAQAQVRSKSHGAGRAEGDASRLTGVAGGASPAPTGGGGAPVGGRRWPAVLAWTAGIAVLATSVASAALTEFGFNRPFERGDLDTARRAADRLEWIGQKSAEMRLRLGHAYLERGDLALARASLERSVEIVPTAWGWTGLGDVHARRGELREAESAYTKAVGIEPAHAVANFRAGLVALDLGRPDRARRALETARRAAATDPDASPALRDAIREALTDPRISGEGR